ncbi:hypothetical protein DRP05_02075 [Archaeoglobales archaeon]|nr:MAG: hypothetical protein DRP05_02075 [Archaeoglobales archaeon]
MKLYKTGIISLDAQLGGGIPGGSVVVIFEDPGAGGDVFTYHFAVEGLKNKEKVLYVSTDDTEEEVREYMKTYFDVDDETVAHLFILDLISPRIGRIAKGSRDFLKKVSYDPLNNINAILSHESFDRVVVNNLTYFFMNYRHDEIFKLFENFSLNAKKNESLFLLTMTKGMFDSRLETTVKHVADGVIELSLREVENEIQRRMKIIKFKKILVPKTILRYDLTEKGIKMESVMRVL